MILEEVEKRHTSHYLQRLEENLGLTPEVLVEVEEMAHKHGTNLPSVAEWLRDGYELDEVNRLLRTRSEIEHMINERVSFPTMMRFQRHFSVPKDPYQFATVIEKIKTSTNCSWDYVSSIMNELVDLGRRRNIKVLRFALKRLNSLHQ